MAHSKRSIKQLMNEKNRGSTDKLHFLTLPRTTPGNQFSEWCSAATSPHCCMARVVVQVEWELGQVRAQLFRKSEGKMK